MANRQNEGGYSLKALPLISIYPNPEQPRQTFNQAKLNELAQSIEQNGLLEPIVVVKNKNRYMIVAGERRWRACQIAKLTEVHVRIIEANAKQIAELALLENLQREDLTVLEEAYGYKAILDKGTTLDELALKLGYPVTTPITQKLKLLELDEFYHRLLLQGHITYHHCLNLAALPRDMRAKFLQKIKEGKVTNTQVGWVMVNALNNKQKQQTLIRPPSKREIAIYKKYDHMLNEISKLIKSSFDWEGTLELLPVALESSLSLNVQRLSLIMGTLKKIQSALIDKLARKEALA